MLEKMELTLLKTFFEIINPWAESIIKFFILVFVLIIIAKIGSNFLMKLINYFDLEKLSFIPEIFEYLVYLLGFIYLLYNAGIFKLALTIFVGTIIIFIIIASLVFIQRILPDYFAGKKLKNMDLKNKTYGKKYERGILNTKYIISKEEFLIVPNKKLLEDLDRGLK